MANLEDHLKAKMDELDWIASNNDQLFLSISNNVLIIIAEMQENRAFIQLCKEKFNSLSQMSKMDQRVPSSAFFPQLEEKLAANNLIYSFDKADLSEQTKCLHVVLDHVWTKKSFDILEVVFDNIESVHKASLMNLLAKQTTVMEE